MKKILFSSAIIALILAACEKDTSLPVRFTANPGGNTNVKFFNFSPGSPQLNFFANSIKSTGANPTTTGAVTGLSNGGIYPSGVAYTTLPSGSVKIDAKVTDSSLVMPGATLLSTTQNFAANKFYSVVMADTFTTPKFYVIEDDPTVAIDTVSYYRVANFLSDSAINVTVTKTSSGYAYTKTFNNVAPGTALPFDTLAAGIGQIYKLEMRRASNNAVLVTVASFTPTRTKKYTLYGRGILKSYGTTGAGNPAFGFYTNF